MLCMVCHKHATFQQTVFRGTEPTHIKLCEPCGTTVDINGRLDAIGSAESHEAKNERVNELLKALGK